MATYFLEIASSVIRAGCVEGYGQKAKLTTYYEERLTVEDNDLPKALPSMIESIAGRLHMSGANVVVGISSRYLIFREAVTPLTDRKKVTKALPFQLEDNIPLAVDEIVIDAFELTRSATNISWFCCCIPKKLLRAILEGSEAAGFDPACVSPSFAGLPFALPDPQTRLVVDFGHDTTNLTIVRGDEVLFCRSLRLAGKTISRSIADSLSVELPVAEETKHLSAGLSDRDPALSEIFNTELTRLAREIKLTLTSLPAASLPVAMVLTGGGAAIGGAAEFLSQKTSLPCIAIKRDDAFHSGELLAKPSSAGFISAAGLAAADNRNSRPVINFRREEFSFHGVFDRIAVPLAIFLFFIAATLVLFAVHFSAQHTKAVTSLDQHNAQFPEWWKSVIQNTPPPNAPEKYAGFLSERKKKLTEEAELLEKVYLQSVTPSIKMAQRLMAGINFKFVKLSADKSAITFEGEVDESDLGKIGEIAVKAKRDFADAGIDTRKIESASGGYRFTARFIIRK